MLKMASVRGELKGDFLSFFFLSFSIFSLLFKILSLQACAAADQWET